MTSADTDEALWGTCTTTISDDPTSTVSNAETTKNVITLNCGSGITLSNEPTDFYIMVPAGTLGTGFTVEAFNGETSIFLKTADWSASPVENFIPRSVIRKVNQNLQIVVNAEPVGSVTTISPTFITKNSALGLGMADATPYQCGFLYAKAELIGTPSNEIVIGGSNVTNVSGASNERFDANLSSLEEDQQYYVRAYVRNADGTIVYGDPILFATRYDYFSPSNKGMSRSTFSVGAGKQVRFFMGNLQYNRQGTHDVANNGTAPGIFRFAENQWDYVGTDNEYMYMESYTGWIDLFGWGTSGCNLRGTEYNYLYHPYDYSSSMYKYGPGPTNASNQPDPAAEFNLTGTYAYGDWGVYNAISNGGEHEPGLWRTLQGSAILDNTAEWAYLVNRSVPYVYKHAQIRVQGTSAHDIYRDNVESHPACGKTVNGLIIFPDTFTWPGIGTFNTLTHFTNFKITEAQWSLFEQAGAVFLPAAGYRNSNNSFNGIGASGYYYSASYGYNPQSGDWYNSPWCACYFGIQDSGVVPERIEPRHRGRSVRLVHDVN